MSIKIRSMLPNGCLNDRDVRIVFAQGKDSMGLMRYRFKGVFRLNKEKTKSDQQAVWEKVNDEVETIKPKPNSDIIVKFTV